jgi:hypothetical protein
MAAAAELFNDRQLGLGIEMRFKRNATTLLR